MTFFLSIIYAWKLKAAYGYSGLGGFYLFIYEFLVSIMVYSFISSILFMYVDLHLGHSCVLHRYICYLEFLNWGKRSSWRGTAQILFSLCISPSWYDINSERYSFFTLNLTRSILTTNFLFCQIESPTWISC